MNRELMRVGAAVIGLMVGADAVAASAPSNAAPNKPGSDKVCVPGENGKGWVCGTRDNPPQVAPSATPAAQRAAPTPQPPPFLANPNRRYDAPPPTIERPAETQALADEDQPSAQEMPAEGSATPASAPTETPSSGKGKGKGKGKDKGHATGAKTAAAPTVAPTPAPAAAPSPPPAASASETVPQPTAASAERAAVEALPEPAPGAAEPAMSAVAPPPAESPAAAATPAPEPPPVAAPVPPPSRAVPAAEPVAPVAARRPAPASELPESGFVIQLARGNNNHGFEQIRGKLKLDRQRAPEIRVGSAAAPEHVLLWSGFPDSKSAQAALNKLPKGTAPGAWVRSVDSLRPLLVDADAPRPAAPARVAAAEPEPTPAARSPERGATPAPAPVAAAAEPAPSPSTRSAALSNTTVAAFAALPGSHYAVQLARAHSTAGFGPLVGTLGIPESSVYSVPVKTTGRLEYLLLWADFPNVEAARAAAARLPASAVQGALARRIGPLQEEARGAR